MSRRLLRPISGVRRARMLGNTYDENTGIVSFRWQGDPVVAPASVTLTNGTVTIGPFAVTGTTANIGTGLADGTWTVTSQAMNSNNELDRVSGSLRIVTVFDWSHVNEIPDLDFSTTQYDFSLVNG